MAQPEWAKEVVAAHSVFEEAGIDVEVGYVAEKERVEAICPDIPPYILFPARSWYISKGVYEQGHLPLLRKQLTHIQDYLDGG